MSRLIHFTIPFDASRVEDPEVRKVIRDIQQTFLMLARDMERFGVNPASGSSFLAADGTAAVPQGYSFLADPNTGMFRPGDNEIGFALDAFEIIRFRNNGVQAGIVVDAANGIGGVATGDQFSGFTVDVDAGSLVRSRMGFLCPQYDGVTQIGYLFDNTSIAAATGFASLSPGSMVLLVSNISRLEVAAAGDMIFRNASASEKMRLTGGGILRFPAASGVIRTQDGVVGTPAHSFDNDTNLGIYRIGADILGFTTAGVEALRINATQQVGIGGAPARLLDVFGTLRNNNNVELCGAASNLGFFTIGPVARAGAYTQTFAAATKTHTQTVGAALTDNTAGTANTTLAALPDPADAPATADALRDDLVANLIPVLRDNYADLALRCNQLRTDLDTAQKVINAIIDDQQAYGLFA